MYKLNSLLDLNYCSEIWVRTGVCTTAAPETETFRNFQSKIVCDNPLYFIAKSNSPTQVYHHWLPRCLRRYIWVDPVFTKYRVNIRVNRVNSVCSKSGNGRNALRPYTENLTLVDSSATLDSLNLKLHLTVDRLTWYRTHW